MASLNNSNSSQVSHQNKLEYRRVLEGLPVEDDTIDNSQRMELIEHALRKAKDLTDTSTTNASERHMDSVLMRKVGQLALCCVEKVEVNTNVYNWRELASQIRTEPDKWQFRLPLQIASFGVTHGAFEPTAPEERPRKPRQRVERQKQAAMKRPEAVDKLVKVDEDSVMIEKVHKFIERESSEGPLSYFHMVLDPHSFSRTVENIYLLSFLAKDGAISIYVCPKKGIPMVRTVSKSEAARNSDSKLNQFVISMDMEYWQKLIDAFGVTEAKMKF